MGVLSAAAKRREERWTYKQFTLASGNKCFQGSEIFLDPSTGKVVSGSNVAAVGLIFLGYSVENVDATSADALVNVNLIEEIVITWFDNGTAGDAVASTDIGKQAFALDDHTVSILATGKSEVGRVWGVDATKGVAVEKVKSPGSRGLAPNPTVPGQVGNDFIPTAIVNGALYDVPATAAASTVTLPAAAPDGTVAFFTADGTKNGHTVQYRDATGPTNLTTALTASKRHSVVVSKLGGKWFANAYVSP